MGLFHTTVGIESPLRRGEVVELPLDIAREKREQRFRMADGGVLDRATGYAILHAGGASTIDEVVFGEPGDPVLLGARTLEGLDRRVDLQAQRLVAGGPIVAAAAA